MTRNVRLIFYPIIVFAALGMISGCSDDPTDSRERPMALSTYNMEFTAWAGSNPNPAQQTVQVVFEGNPAANWSATTDADWLRIGPLGTDTIYVTVISNNLAAGDYVDSIAVDVTAASNGPRYVTVDLTVLNQVTLNPSSMSFATLAGGTVPPIQELVVANFGAGSATYVAETTAPWLVLGSSTGDMPDTIDVTVDISGMNAGYYSDSIVVNSPELPASRAVVYCTLSLSSWASFGLGRTDVALEDVQFVDHQSGWASGWLPSDNHQGYVLRSDDEGEHWLSVFPVPNSNIFGGLAALDAARCFVVGDAAIMYRTNDSGRTWQHIVGLPLTSDVVLRDIYFADFAHGWAIGSGGTIISTADSGSTWTKRNTPTSYPLSGVSFLDTQIGWTCGDHGTVLHTGDGGVTWVAQSTGSNIDLRSISFADNLHGWAAGADGLILHTDDGGATWGPQDDMGSVLLLDVAFVNAQIGWVVGIDGSIHRTDDGGETWVEQASGTTQALTEVFFVDDSYGWVVGGSGTVIRTANGGF